MNITIVTVYNSHNYGSFLQAQMLKKELEEYGEVSFYNSHTRKLSKTLFRNLKKLACSSTSLLMKIRGGGFETIETVRLFRCWRMLPSKDSFTATDVLVVGSDEIWNLTRAECRHPVYWGAGTDAYKIAYAPSMNNAQEVDLLNNPEYVNYLKEINMISARDNHTLRVVEKIGMQNCKLVLDPTLLAAPLERDFCFPYPYIAVYIFPGSLNIDQIAAIRRYAAEHGLKIVSCGQYIDWCDISVHSIDGDPFYAYKNAKFVVTNTFHGTAFAINHNKQFVAFAKGKNKVINLLEQFGLLERNVVEYQEFSRIIEKPIDYESVNDILSNLKDTSKNFLATSIGTYQNSISGEDMHA